MEKCVICSRDMLEWGETSMKHLDHLVVTKSIIDGHIHTHGDLDKKEVMAELIESAKNEIGIFDQVKKGLDRKEIVFHNRQRIGDILTFTSAIRDFHAAFPEVRLNVISTCMHLWDHNPAIDKTLVATEENTVKIGPGTLTNASNRINRHMTESFRISMEEKLGITIPQGESRPDIWLTEEEYNSPRPFPMPYWIICTTGEKGWGCKMYPTKNWQKVVDQNPDITFVQIGTAEDNAPRLQGKNVIDHIGKTQSRETGVRDLFKLFLHAEGSIGLVSFHMHLSGALYKPCVVVAGGREPVAFTRYAGHAYLSNDGMLPCSVKACWHCDINACTNLIIKDDTKIPKCVDIIGPEDITRAIRGYYRGGRLKIGVPCEKPKLKNVVKTPEKKEAVSSEGTPAPYGMTWGGGCITDLDWDFINGVIKKYGVKSVLEFGAGLSTLLMTDLGLDVQTFETQQGWIDRIMALSKKPKINLWDGGWNLPLPMAQYDLAFVDGPAGGVNREAATAIAARSANIVIVHDANREFEKIWQGMYLKAEFDGPTKGGHRCHLWVKKTAKHALRTSSIKAESIVNGNGDVYELKMNELPKHTQELVAPKSKKHIKIVSTARGWGGCARSCTTIMDLLLKAGHYVEFIPFRGSVTSAEYKQMLNTTLKGVKVRENMEGVSEACDVLLVYGDDYIWEFPNRENTLRFSNLNAEKKIMMLNFRRGKVGEIPWTREWDLYAFLNSTQERELLKVHPGAKTKVLPPCTILDDFLAIKPDYERNIRIVRHSSQGDTKFSPNIGEEITAMFNDVPDLEMSMIPGPSFIPEFKGFRKLPKTADHKVIAEFLATGNMFWYSLPTGYMDMGPRVILEAMAVGLPILADNWGGAVDRVTPECGWLCNNKHEHVQVVREATLEEIKRKGIAAKERAFAEFRPEKWLEILTK